MRQVFNLQNWCIVKVQGGEGSLLYKQCMKIKNNVKPAVKLFTVEDMFRKYLNNKQRTFSYSKLSRNMHKTDFYFSWVIGSTII